MQTGLQSCYSSAESVLGYDVLLGGTRHFGYYDNGKYNPFPINRGLRRMEGQLFKSLRLPPKSKALDSGCGNGHVGRFMVSEGKLLGSGLEDGAIEEMQHMDQCHLETFKDGEFDGVYTMETFVHTNDPDKVPDGFFRIIKPGGRIAMHEYDNMMTMTTTSNNDDNDDSSTDNTKDIPDDLKRSMKQVKEWSTMPTNAISTPGAFKATLQQAGFVDVEVRDLSDNIVPLMRLFYVLAIVPFFFVSMLGLEGYCINMVVGVGAYRGRKYWRYVQIEARKPE